MRRIKASAVTPFDTTLMIGGQHALLQIAWSEVDAASASLLQRCLETS